MLTKRIHPVEFALIAVIILAFAAVLMAVRTPTLGGSFELARYNGAGDRYVEDYGLSWEDCIDALGKPHGDMLQCEAE